MKRHRGFGCLIEALDARRLLASAAPYLGTYSGTETYLVNGVQQTATETVTISATSKVSALDRDHDVKMAIRELIGPEASLDSVVDVALTTDDSPDAFVPSTGHETAQAETIYSGDFPSSIGTGNVLIQGSELSFSATINNGIFSTSPFSFDGNKVATKAVKSAAPAATTPKVTTLSLNQVLKANPAFGIFKGHMTLASNNKQFTTSATIAKNSKGHTAIAFQLVDTGIGTIEIDSVIHPTHTGSFTLDLGDSSVDGIFGGHITHTGRLILDLTVPGVSIVVGSQKRHG